MSTDGGASFTGTDTDVRELPSATLAPRQRTTDQWFQSAAFIRDGKLATTYYDRQYGADELTGWSDFSLSGSRGLERFGVRRVTTSSMPPPTQFAGGFFGDYTGLAADRLAYPAWSDTRNPAPVLCPGTGTPGTPPRLCVTPGPQRPLQQRPGDLHRRRPRPQRLSATAAGSGTSERHACRSPTRRSQMPAVTAFGSRP